LRKRLEEARHQGYRYAVFDTLTQEHLDLIGVAVSDFPLLTGGSGLAASLARLTLRDEAQVADATMAGLPSPGKTVVLAGSCSTATNQQVARYREMAPFKALEVARCLEDPSYAKQLLDWTREQLAADRPAPMLFATTSPEELQNIQERFAGRDVGAAIEAVFGTLAAELKKAGVRNFIVAGGETAGVVVQSLGLSAFHIGPQIDPGVPWVKAVGQPLFLALKSGNFGSEDFFSKAQEMYQ
jgi:uncharacterized protein YgbK (DUF1537 family)